MAETLEKSTYEMAVETTSIHDPLSRNRVADEGIRDCLVRPVGRDISIHMERPTDIAIVDTHKRIRCDADLCHQHNSINHRNRLILDLGNHRLSRSCRIRIRFTRIWQFTLWPPRRYGHRERMETDLPILTCNRPGMATANTERNITYANQTTMRKTEKPNRNKHNRNTNVKRLD